MGKSNKPKKTGAKRTVQNVVTAFDQGGKAVRAFKRKDIAKGISHALRSADATVKGGVAIVKAITGRDSNAKSWYCIYEQINPARNEGRQMAPRFNLDITDNPTLGSIPRFVDVEMSWADYSEAFAFEQTVTNSYQLLRLALKSNLPYKRNKLKAYLINSTSLAIALKEIERDCAWRNYSRPDIYNFPEMYILRNNSAVGVNGKVELTREDYLADENWPVTIAAYDRLRRLTNTNLRVAPSLSMFISHYFGTVFVDSDDGYNPQFMINRMHVLPFASYDEETDKVSVRMRDLTDINLNEVTQLVVEMGVKYGMVIADLVKSEQYVPLEMDDLEAYDYIAIYDPSYLQALANGYTSPSAVTEDGYIRMDRMSDVEDDLTQYIFLGALQQWKESESGNSGVDSLAQFPTISIQSMTIKFDSDGNLNWSIGLFEHDGNVPTEEEPFGISFTTDIVERATFQIYGQDTQANDTYTETRTLPASGKPIYSASAIPFKINAAYTVAPEYGTDYTPDRMLLGYQAKAIDGFSSGYYNVSQIPSNGFPIEPSGTAGDYSVDVLVTLGAAPDDSTNGLVLCAARYTFIGQIGAENTVRDRELTYQGLVTFEISSRNYDASYAPVYINASADKTYGNLQGLAPQLISDFTVRDITQTQGYVTFRNKVDGSNIVTVSLGAVRRQSGNYTLTVQKAVSSVTSKDSVPQLYDIIRDGTSYTTGPTVTVAITTSTGGAFASAEAQIAYGQLAACAADWVDKHLPIMLTQNIEAYYEFKSVVAGRDARNTISLIGSQPTLIKEAYIPYFYNILDLTPVLYDMWNSLLTPTADMYKKLTTPRGRIQNTNRDRRRNSNKESRPPRKEVEDEKTSKDLDDHKESYS